MIKRILSKLRREYKQVILVRADLRLPKGKMAAQVAHASVECTLKSTRNRVMAWRRQGMKKVVLKVKDLRQLKYYATKAGDARLITSLISDAGHTTVKPGTTTCVGIGPAVVETIDGITGNLKMM